MSNSQGGTLHVFVVVGEGLKDRVAWSKVRGEALKRSALVSVSTIDASGVRLLLPATPAADAPPDPAGLAIPDNLGLPVAPVGDRILDQIYEARSSVASIQRTEVRLYADEDTKTELTNHLKGVTDIELIVEAVSAKRRPRTARPVANVQTNPPVSPPEWKPTARQTASRSRASATPTSGPRASGRAPHGFRDSVRGASFWAALAAAATATGLHVLSHTEIKSAMITATLMWLLAVLLSAARHFVPRPDTSVIRIARAGRVLIVIALAVAAYHMLMQLKVQPGCGMSCTTLPASSWKAIPIAVVIGTWGSYLLNLGIDIQLAGWTAATRKPARWLALPASIIGAASLGSEVLMRIDHVIATVAPWNYPGAAVESAGGSFSGAVAAVRDFVEPFVSALPGWATGVVPTLAALSGLAMFLGAKDLQRWSPRALPLTRLLVIASGLAADAILLNTFSTVVIAMG